MKNKCKNYNLFCINKERLYNHCFLFLIDKCINKTSKIIRKSEEIKFKEILYKQPII